ncbi:hypothetical protein I4F81_001967 [Pyropia yezoensis]|uniref:Uncharacterized protein n=1 Tax=Pyropia yezoensis TaxID=2788 RepID=A0ACC3BPE7_PYRYE|nr:hypothetical protein I4F81_001967 [Neopyropia yezoensis]
MGVKEKAAAAAVVASASATAAPPTPPPPPPTAQRRQQDPPTAAGSGAGRMYTGVFSPARWPARRVPAWLATAFGALPWPPPLTRRTAQQPRREGQGSLPSGVSCARRHPNSLPPPPPPSPPPLAVLQGVERSPQGCRAHHCLAIDRGSGAGEGTSLHLKNHAPPTKRRGLRASGEGRAPLPTPPPVSQSPRGGGRCRWCSCRSWSAAIPGQAASPSNSSLPAPPAHPPPVHLTPRQTSAHPIQLRPPEGWGQHESHHGAPARTTTHQRGHRNPSPSSTLVAVKRKRGKEGGRRRGAGGGGRDDARTGHRKSRWGLEPGGRALPAPPPAGGWGPTACLHVSGPALGHGGGAVKEFCPHVAATDKPPHKRGGGRRAPACLTSHRQRPRRHHHRHPSRCHRARGYAGEGGKRRERR